MTKLPEEIEEYPDGKVCSRCKKYVPFSGFYSKEQSYCIKCNKEHRAEYRKSDRAKYLRWKRRQNPENKKKRSARYKVRNEWVNGRIPHPKTLDCYICGNGVKATHYHHHLGYEPEHALDVIPLCWKHKDMDAGKPKTLPAKPVQISLFGD